MTDGWMVEFGGVMVMVGECTSGESFWLRVGSNQAKVTEGSGLKETTKEEPGWRFLSTLI